MNTQDATLGNNLIARQLTDLPSEGRDPVAILSLQPGVVYIGNKVDQNDDSRGGAVMEPAAIRPTSRWTAWTTTIS